MAPASFRCKESVLMALSMTTCAVLGAIGASPAAGKSEASPPGYTTARTGDQHDFDYFAAAWTTQQRRLKVRGAGNTEWEEFPATLCMSLYLDGMASVDELYFPTKGWAGLTLRTFDLDDRTWETNWTADFIRADAASVCNAGRPKR